MSAACLARIVARAVDIYKTFRFPYFRIVEDVNRGREDR